MSNNSYPCRAGGEIGRAQVAQAEACGLEPEPAMNPILLKPSGNGTSQVVVNGRVWKTLSAREYYAHADELRATVLEAYDDLSSRFDVIVIEGAGSVTELNLRDHDLVNLGLVTRIRAPWLLVADIERGGVFGSVIGTAHLLTADERSLFRGFAINKFRGDMSLFDEGVRILEERTGVTLLRRVPVRGRHAPGCRGQPGAADATEHAAAAGRAAGDRPLPAPVERDGFPAADVGGLDHVAAVPTGTISSSCPAARTRSPIWRGCVRSVWRTGSSQQHRRGATVIGICGGYQMLGRAIRDPAGHGVGRRAKPRGSGLLPAVTELAREKRTRAVTATTPGGVRFGGYEIHLGVTTLDRRDDVVPFARLDDGGVDGVRGAGVIGTYLHGAFEHPDVCAEVFGIDAPVATSKADQYQRLAAWFEQHGAPSRPAWAWTDRSIAGTTHALGTVFCSSPRSSFGDPAGFSWPI